MFAERRDSVVKARLNRAKRNFQDRGALFERKIVLVVKQKDCSTGGRESIKEGQEGLVGWLA